MIRPLVTATIGLFLCLTSQLDHTFGQTDSASVVNLEKSRVVIFVDKTGFGHQHAVVGKLSEGHIRLGTASAAGKLVFDMTSFVADPPEGRTFLKLEEDIKESVRKQVTAAMLGREVLDVKQYPTAAFEIASAEQLAPASGDGHPRYRLQGQFTLHGKTQPLSIEAEAAPDSTGVRLYGSFELQQTQFGIKPYRKAFGAVGVKDVLTVYGEIYLGN